MTHARTLGSLAGLGLAVTGGALVLSAVLCVGMVPFSCDRARPQVVGLEDVVRDGAFSQESWERVVVREVGWGIAEVEVEVDCPGTSRDAVRQATGPFNEVHEVAVAEVLPDLGERLGAGRCAVKVRASDHSWSEHPVSVEQSWYGYADALVPWEEVASDDVPPRLDGLEDYLRGRGSWSDVRVTDAGSGVHRVRARLACRRGPTGQARMDTVDTRSHSTRLSSVLPSLKAEVRPGRCTLFVVMHDHAGHRSEVERHLFSLEGQVIGAEALDRDEAPPTVHGLEGVLDPRRIRFEDPETGLARVRISTRCTGDESNRVQDHRFDDRITSVATLQELEPGLLGALRPGEWCAARFQVADQAGNEASEVVKVYAYEEKVVSARVVEDDRDAPELPRLGLRQTPEELSSLEVRDAGSGLREVSLMTTCGGATHQKTEVLRSQRGGITLGQLDPRLVHHLEPGACVLDLDAVDHAGNERHVDEVVYCYGDATCLLLVPLSQVVADERRPEVVGLGRLRGRMSGAQAQDFWEQVELRDRGGAGLAGMEVVLVHRRRVLHHRDVAVALPLDFLRADDRLGPLPLRGLAQGRYLVELRAWDHAGNEEVQRASFRLQ